MEPMRLSEIAELVGGRLSRPDQLADDAPVSSTGDDPGDPVITGVASLAEAGPGDLSFLDNKKLIPLLETCGASAVIVGPDQACALPAIRVDRPYHAFTRVLERLALDLDRMFPPGVHATAVIDETADVAGAEAIGPYCVIGAGVTLGAGTRLGSHVVVGPEVRIGDNCRLHAGVVIRERCRLGNDVVLHSGCLIGIDGFGYLPDRDGLRKIPQVGTVEIQDGVELGAGVCVDRATTGKTVVGAGTKIDNMVQVAHNVTIGRSCAISGHSGLAGSVVLGDGVTVGGRVAVADHLHIGDGARIAGGSALTRDVPAGQTVFGYPAVEFNEGFRMVAAMRRLPGLLRRVQELETALADLQRDKE